MKPGRTADKKALIQSIIKAEWTMFQQVRSASPVACQQSPEQFKRIRVSLFSTWSEALLASYLKDLERAREQGRNLLMEKYARMDDMLDPPAWHPLIAPIVDIEYQWQRDIEQNYPSLYRRVCRKSNEIGDGSDFSKYLQSELETYSPETVELYFCLVNDAHKENHNLALQALDYLVRSNGFINIQQAEEFIGGSLSENNATN